MHPCTFAPPSLTCDFNLPRLNGSRAQGTLWLLEELQVPYELDIHHREPTRQAPPAIRKLHPLGKFPIISVTPPRRGTGEGAASQEPLVLAESAFIVQYLSEHFTHARNLVPKRWKDGREGTVGGETEAWMRYQYLMYYVEGSFMFTFVLYFILWTFGAASGLPFFVRPVTRFLANQISGLIVVPNAKRHFGMLEEYLAAPPDGGGYICGPQLTGADILLAYPLLTGLEGDLLENMTAWEKGSFSETYPKLRAYMARLAEEPGWKRSLEKIKAIEGSCSLLP